MLTHKTLVLNSDATPIAVIPWYRAIALIHIREIAVELNFYDNIKLKDSKERHYTLPAVIILKKYIHRPPKVPPFSKKNILIRDDYTCQYCGKRAGWENLTIDHIIPRSKWKGVSTPTNWRNIVTCCYKCNNKKGNKSLHDSGLKLLKVPYEPKITSAHFLIRRLRHIPSEWTPYLDE